jgi:2-polyprenyl-3-methyl-5-hydroxy-6-metoxy-1,4-benzoquinol methylase
LYRRFTMTQVTETFDQAKAEAFAGKMLEVLNASGVALFSSVGHQTGLFDVMAGLPPSTSDEIASAAGLNERYVREWLGGLTLARVLEYDPGTATYRLPPEHAAFLTREAGPDNFAFFMQYIPLIGIVEGEVVEAFRHGGGVPYSSFPNFQEIQREETARVYDAALIEAILPLAGPVIEKLRDGTASVLDIGCGAGHAINLMAREFPAARFTGYDFSEDGIALARKEAESWGLTNARFELQDIAEAPDVEAYDLITALDVIHDQARPRQVLAAAARALKPGGTFFMGDIAMSSKLEENLGHPMGPALFMFSAFHCMTVSLAQGGEGLGTCWGEQKARELLAEAGFTSVSTGQVESDILNIYYTCRK